MAEGGIDTSIEMQRNVRNNTTDMQESIKELLVWEKEMRAKEMAMMNSREGWASGSAPTDCRAAAVVPCQPCEHSDAPVALAHAGTSLTTVSFSLCVLCIFLSSCAQQFDSDAKYGTAGNSPSQQATEHVKQKTAAEHTYEHFKDRWERFDVDAALAEVDAEPAAAPALQHAYKRVVRVARIQ